MAELMEAVYSNDIERVRFLLDQGADININHQHNSPLLSSTISGDIDMVRLLLNRGADPNIDNIRPRALIYAACSNNIHMVELLLNSGADINHGDMQGNTALTYAGYLGHSDILELLLYRGADTSLWKYDCTTVIDMDMDTYHRIVRYPRSLYHVKDRSIGYMSSIYSDICISCCE